MPTPTDKDLYEKVKSLADKIYDKPSAYKSGYIVKTYKELGGKYSGKKPDKKGLDRWFKEEWEDIGGQDYPVYRPTKKITKDTPLTPKEIDPVNLVEQIIKKQSIKGKSNLDPFKKLKGLGLPTADINKLLEKSYEKKPSDYGDYKVDNGLSGQRVQVYHNDKTGKAIIVHRGTDSIQDWGTNIAMNFGYRGDRFKHARKIQREAERKYGNQNVITLGHSQGGRWAEKLGRDTSEVITLNKPTLPIDLIKGDVVPENQTDIRTESDPVSILRPLQKGKETEKIKSNWFSNPLIEHSVNVLERINPMKMIGLGTPYNITPYTKKQAKKLGVKVRPSTKKGKKIDVLDWNNQYIMSVGARGYGDYPTYMKEKGKEYADERRRLYKIRHNKHREKLGTASYYADKLLW
jgi:hypothetical protein